MTDEWDKLREKHKKSKDLVTIILTRIVFIATILLIFSAIADAKVDYANIDCNKHKIYCKIIDLRPNMYTWRAMKLSNTLYKYSKKYNQDALISVAIAMQETTLQNISRKQNIIIYDNNSYQIVRGYTDICMFQFHVNTIVNYKLDAVRLKNDRNYCIEQHFKLMRIKRNSCKKLGKDSWTCYHSRSKKLRLFYKSLVSRYL